MKWNVRTWEGLLWPCSTPSLPVDTSQGVAIARWSRCLDAYILMNWVYPEIVSTPALEQVCTPPWLAASSLLANESRALLCVSHCWEGVATVKLKDCQDTTSDILVCSLKFISIVRLLVIISVTKGTLFRFAFRSLSSRSGRSRHSSRVLLHYRVPSFVKLTHSSVGKMMCSIVLLTILSV